MLALNVDAKLTRAIADQIAGRGVPLAEREGVGPQPHRNLAATCCASCTTSHLAGRRQAGKPTTASRLPRRPACLGPGVMPNPRSALSPAGGPRPGGGRHGQRPRQLRPRRAHHQLRDLGVKGDNPAAGIRSRSPARPRCRASLTRSSCCPPRHQPRAAPAGVTLEDQGRACIAQLQPWQPRRALAPPRPGDRIVELAGARQQRRGERGDPPPAARHLAALQGGAQRRGGDRRALPAAGPEARPMTARPSCPLSATLSARMSVRLASAALTAAASCSPPASPGPRRCSNSTSPSTRPAGRSRPAPAEPASAITLLSMMLQVTGASAGGRA